MLKYYVISGLRYGTGCWVIPLNNEEGALSERNVLPKDDENTVRRTCELGRSFTDNGKSKMTDT